MKTTLRIGFFLVICFSPCSAADFFSIKEAKYLSKEPKDGIAPWRLQGDNGRFLQKPLFQPCLVVEVSAQENIRAKDIRAKAYFFDKENKLVASLSQPSKSGLKANRDPIPMPGFFYKNKPERLFFAVPRSIEGNSWKAVIVFGDETEIKTALYPKTISDFALDYPEKKRANDRSVKNAERKPAMDPLIEQVIKTKDPKRPQITLFLRPPAGVTNPEEVKGVLAFCCLSSHVEALKAELQREEMDGDYKGFFTFANKHKLAILAWGSSGMWNRNRNVDELSKEEAATYNEAFDTVADAWEQGAVQLCEKYGLPKKDFLLWGACGSANWAARLCLRKPKYFLAISVHIPGSFDIPTPEGNKVLWCLTTGELYGGYERSLKFVQECRKLGYPMVYKAVPGLGHGPNVETGRMAFRFFEFALSMKEARAEWDKKTATAALSTPKKGESTPPQPWPEIFRNPPFYGDYLNQQMYPKEKVEMIPAALRIPLPTKELAENWERAVVK